MMSDELKPCPFCKNRSNIKLVEYRPNCSGAVVCGQCGARGPKKKNDHVRGWRVKAIEAWNARVVVTDEQFAMAVHNGEAWQKVRTCGQPRGFIPYDSDSFGNMSFAGLWCEHCDIELDPEWQFCPSCGAKVVR